MDISNLFPHPTISEGTRRRYILSYRRYKRLSQKEKEIFDLYKGQYTPNEWRLALHIKTVLKKPFKKRFFKLAKKLKPGEVEQYWLHHGFSCSSNEVNYNSQALANEFKFQGFKPIMEFKHYEEGFAYIISNREFGGTYWIYPKKLADNYLTYNKRYKDLWPTFSSVGIPGCTYARQSLSHINYPGVEKKLKSLKELNDSRRHKIN